jgi:hypothetical protein
MIRCRFTSLHSAAVSHAPSRSSHARQVIGSAIAAIGCKTGETEAPNTQWRCFDGGIFIGIQKMTELTRQYSPL